MYIDCLTRSKWASIADQLYVHTHTHTHAATIAFHEFSTTDECHLSTHTHCTVPLRNADIDRQIERDTERLREREKERLRERERKRRKAEATSHPMFCFMANICGEPGTAYKDDFAPKKFRVFTATQSSQGEH